MQHLSSWEKSFKAKTNRYHIYRVLFLKIKLKKWGFTNITSAETDGEKQGPSLCGTWICGKNKWRQRNWQHNQWRMQRKRNALLKP